MTNLHAIVDAMLADRSRSLGYRYPDGTTDRLIEAAEMARKKTAHLEDRRIAGIQAMDVELERIEQQLFT